MNAVPVAWLSLHPETPKRGYWDMTLLDDLLNGKVATPAGFPKFEHHEVDTLGNPAFANGAVVVFPARYHRHTEIAAELDRLPWAVVMVVGDEESTFPWWRLRGENRRLFVMTPRPLHLDEVPTNDVTFIGEGYTPHTRKFGRSLGAPVDDPALPWWFSGQNNHSRRREIVQALQQLHADHVYVSTGFSKGLAPEVHISRLADARIAPCPSGPATPDSFRAYEALEIGCLPMVDSTCSAYSSHEDARYWETIGMGWLPQITDPAALGAQMDRLLADWPHASNHAFARWIAYKRDLAVRLATDIDLLDGSVSRGVDDEITVIIPTSPIPSHPSTDVIGETIASVRERLPHAEIIVAIDQVRPELAHRQHDYDLYVRRLLWRMNYEWHNVVPVMTGEWLHQANLTKLALGKVRTSLVLFVEHDTPLCGNVPFAGLADAIHMGHADVIRLHHEANVLEPHMPMMVGEPETYQGWSEGVRLWRTFQWSQRPHLASAVYYRRMLDTYFGPNARTMIEDAMHGVIATGWKHGERSTKLYLYAPEGDMKRSLHLDGRGDDPKFEMRYEYDDGTPEFAPRATSERES